MPIPTIYPLDLNFHNTLTSIASYLIPHAEGGVLVECGPGSTLPTMQARLKDHNLTPQDITDVFVTHIHLDHAGAAGWFANQGARIHVHHVGAQHLLDPAKLIASASRIYGDKMDELWGKFLPVPADKLNILHDEDEITVNDLVFRALDTPGHAYHHMAYILDGVCFSGDVGGVRIAIPGYRHLRLPMPPPGLHLDKWRATIQRLQQENIHHLALTHFGIFDDVEWHFQAISEALDAADAWIRDVMPRAEKLENGEISKNWLRKEFMAWAKERALAAGLTEDLLNTYEEANPSGMSADGLLRYWRKFIKE
ncbi:MAG: MBL fold metallo-hydrolase [Chloroflexota bacterium]|nr:MAG: MBL fold metallo-hydrolase [Chloroflexota bacterium]